MPREHTRTYKLTMYDEMGISAGSIFVGLGVLLLLYRFRQNAVGARDFRRILPYG